MKYNLGILVFSLVPVVASVGCSASTPSGTAGSGGTSASSSGNGGASSSSSGEGGAGGGSSSSSSSSSGAGGSGGHAFSACTDTTGSLKDCKNCCDCAASLSCADQKACRDTCNMLGAPFFMMNPNPMPVNAPSMLGSGGDYSACTSTSADEQACKECCDCTMTFLCGDHQFCRNACTAAFGDGGAPPPADAGGDGG